jgi:hypothetical protein
MKLQWGHQHTRYRRLMAAALRRVEAPVFVGVGDPSVRILMLAQTLAAEIKALSKTANIHALVASEEAYGHLDNMGLVEEPTGYVYFIQHGVSGSIKIGFTRDVRSRTSTLQTAAPFGLKVLGQTPGTMTTEAKLHHEFRKDRLNGEWFHPSVALLAFIGSLPKASK